MPGGIHPPIEVLSTWPFDYENYETGGHYIVVLTAFLLGLAFVTVAVRIYSRVYLSKSFGIDDALIIFNMIPLTGTAVGVILAFERYGFDRHVWNIPTPTLLDARKVTWAIEALYMVSTCTTKISILLFYRRLAAGTISPMYLCCIYVAIGYVVVYFGIFFFVMPGLCTPLSVYWNQADWFWYENHKGTWTCLPEAELLIASAVISASQDFIAVFIPSILLWKLQMATKQKVGLMAVFALGIFLSVCAVFRTIHIYRVYYETYDMTWEAKPAWLWLIVEAEVAIICASAPALNVFFKRAFQATVKSFTSSSKASKDSSHTPRNKAHPRADSARSTQPLGHHGSSADCEADSISLSSEHFAMYEYDKYGQKILTGTSNLGLSHGASSLPTRNDSLCPRTERTFFEDADSIEEAVAHLAFPMPQSRATSSHGSHFVPNLDAN